MRFLKTMILFFVVFLLVGMFAFSAEINWGIKAAPTFTALTGSLEDPIDYSNEEGMGFVFGAYGRVSTDDGILSIQPELLLSHVRSHIFLEFPLDDIDLSLWYLELPVMFRAAFPLPLDGYYAPFVIGGPKVGVKLSDNVADDGIYINTLEFAVVFGFGMDFGDHSVEVRYARDIRKIHGGVRKDVVSIFYSRNFGKSG